MTLKCWRAAAPCKPRCVVELECDVKLGEHCQDLDNKIALVNINANQLHIHLTEIVHQASSTTPANYSFSFLLRCLGVI